MTPPLLLLSHAEANSSDGAGFTSRHRNVTPSHHSGFFMASIVTVRSALVSFRYALMPF